MISRTELQRVSQLQDDSGHLLSLYLPLFGEASDIDYNIELKNLLREASQRYPREKGRELPAEFEDLFETIRIEIRDNATNYGRGIALFASPERGVIEAHSMPGSIESSAIVNNRANVAPLIRLIEDYGPYCTCVISRDEARIFLGAFDEIHEHEHLKDDEVPGQHDQGGWSQARYERHIEDHVHRHFKRVAEHLFELQDEHPFDSLILGGPDEVVSGFREVLHPYVHGKLIGDVRLLMEANINDVRAQSLQVVEEHITERKRELIEQVKGEAQADDLGVDGLTATIDALQLGQVQTLLVDSQIRSSGIVCQSCGAFAVMPGPDNTCPYCESGQINDVDNIIPYLITSAHEQGAGVAVIDDDDQKEHLGRLGGIAALLRFRVEEQTA